MVIIHPDGRLAVDPRCYAPVYGGAERDPLEPYSEVLPRLFLGGTPDEDWLDTEGASGGGAGADPAAHFDAVVTLFPRARPWHTDAEELRCEFTGAQLHTPDVLDILDIAGWAHRRWAAGQRVLIRCQDGLNKSALIAALVDMMRGTSAEAAIRWVRAARAPIALSHREFVDWLVLHAVLPPLPPIADEDGECIGIR